MFGHVVVVTTLPHQATTASSTKHISLSSTTVPAATTRIVATQGRGWTVWIKSPTVDIKTLTFLNDRYGTLSFAKDKHHVYFCCYPDARWVVPGADPRTFVLVGPGDYYEKDHYSVYHYGLPIFGADPATFVVFPEEPHYGKDAHHVYSGDTIVQGADPATFQFYDSYKVYSRDRTHVFWEGGALPTADPGSFVPLPMTSKAAEAVGAQYGKDTHHVYIENTIVQGADPATFLVLSHPTATADAQDASHYYREGEVVR